MAGTGVNVSSREQGHCQYRRNFYLISPVTMLVFLASALIGLGAALPLSGSGINFDCSVAEGVVWWGCGSYGLCLSGQYSQVDCVNGTVYNRQQQQCSEASSAPYPCSSPNPSCAPYEDSPGHRVPDIHPDTYDNRPPCSYYYTCSYGRFLGYQACSEGMVYDEADQRCNEPGKIPAPCGFGPEREEEGEVQVQGLGPPASPQGSYGPSGGQGQRGQGGQGGQGYSPPQQQQSRRTPFVPSPGSPYGGGGSGQSLDPWARLRYRA